MGILGGKLPGDVMQLRWFFSLVVFAFIATPSYAQALPPELQQQVDRGTLTLEEAQSINRAQHNAPSTLSEHEQPWKKVRLKRNPARSFSYGPDSFFTNINPWKPELKSYAGLTLRQPIEGQVPSCKEGLSPCYELSKSIKGQKNDFFVLLDVFRFSCPGLFDPKRSQPCQLQLYLINGQIESVILVMTHQKFPQTEKALEAALVKRFGGPVNIQASSDGGALVVWSGERTRMLLYINKKPESSSLQIFTEDCLGLMLGWLIPEEIK
jgi:hypothetical protein